MNIYEKQQAARIALQKSPIKKTGRNNFAGYDYYELDDFLPTIDVIMEKLKMTTVIYFVEGMGMMDIVNCEKPEEFIRYSCPMTNVEIKGANSIQNLGAAQTYIRRYLLQNAFNISEGDAVERVPVDAIAPPELKPAKTIKNEAKTEAAPPPDVNEPMVISPEQQKKLIETSKKFGWSAMMSKKLLRDEGFSSSATITTDKIDKILTKLQDMSIWDKYSEKEG